MSRTKPDGKPLARPELRQLDLGLLLLGAFLVVVGALFALGHFWPLTLVAAGVSAFFLYRAPQAERRVVGCALIGAGLVSLTLTNARDYVWPAFSVVAGLAVVSVAFWRAAGLSLSQAPVGINARKAADDDERPEIAREHDEDAGARPAARRHWARIPVAVVLTAVLAFASTVLGAGINAGWFRSPPSPTVSITSPTSGQLADYGFTVAGEMSHIPHGQHIWLADKVNEELYPEKEILSRPDFDEAVVGLAPPGTKFTVVVLMVGSNDQQKMLEHQREILVAADVNEKSEALASAPSALIKLAPGGWPESGDKPSSVEPIRESRSILQLAHLDVQLRQCSVLSDSVAGAATLSEGIDAHIQQPKQKSTVDQSENVNGWIQTTSTVGVPGLLAGRHLWVVIKPPGEGVVYYPQVPLEVHENSSTLLQFGGSISFGATKGSYQILLVAVDGDGGNTFCDYYTDSAAKNSYPGMLLPSDAKPPLASVSVDVTRP